MDKHRCKCFSTPHRCASLFLNRSRRVVVFVVPPCRCAVVSSCFRGAKPCEPDKLMRTKRFVRAPPCLRASVLDLLRDLLAGLDHRPPLIALALCALIGCAARTLPGVTEPAAAQLFAGARTDVARFGADSNEGRFEVLTTLLTERRLAFEVEPFTITPRKGETRTEGRNVIVTLAGDEPELVVGAHYDAVRLRDGRFSKGAVDNAASVVVLVRIAEALSRSRPDRRIRIVFFDMEELGLLGSAQYIQEHPDRKPLAMVNLDVNAFGDTLIYGPRTQTNAGVVRSMQQACGDVSRACVEFPRMPPSDDISFQKAGIPVVSIATVPQVQAHQLWLVMNGGAESGLPKGFAPRVLRTIHTEEDTASLVDPDAMARVYRAVLNLIARLDR